MRNLWRRSQGALQPRLWSYCLKPARSALATTGERAAEPPDTASRSGAGLALAAVAFRSRTGRRRSLRTQRAERQALEPQGSWRQPARVGDPRLVHLAGSLVYEVGLRPRR